MTIQKTVYDELEQYDYLDGEYLEKIAPRYSPLIGLFLINFSTLEHNLNQAIANFIHDNADEVGYVIIEKLSMGNKIDLFYKIYARLEFFKEKKHKDRLDKIIEQLKTLNIFRNNVAHANWLSLSKDGLVRTKIVVDNQDGYVKFQKIKITLKVLRDKIKEINKLDEQIDKYTETAFDF